MLPSPMTLLPTFTPVPTPIPGVLFVDAAQEPGPISPLVYGTNYDPWQNLTSSMMPYAEEAGFTFLRFPGGNWGDEYLLTIGPQRLRLRHWRAVKGAGVLG